jgi:uncharacterized membrane protein
MSSNDTAFFLRALGFGALAGSRSLSPPALLSLFLARRSPAPDHAVAQRIRSTQGIITLNTLALGELVADKLPQAPNRTLLPALLGRMITGGGSSALLCSLSRRPTWIGGVGGAAAALGATYLTFYLRRWLGRVLPGSKATSWAGLLEDGIVWGGGWWLLSQIEQHDLRS